MSMTESEVIERIKYRIATARELVGSGSDGNAFEDLEFAISAIKELRELKEKATPKKPIYGDFDENGEIDKNGEEVIIPYKATCPVCRYEFEFGTWNDEQNHHCKCGQRMLWD